MNLGVRQLLLIVGALAHSLAGDVTQVSYLPASAHGRPRIVATDACALDDEARLAGRRNHCVVHEVPVQESQLALARRHPATRAQSTMRMDLRAEPRMQLAVQILRYSS